MPRNRSEKDTPTIVYLREWYKRNPERGFMFSAESRRLYEALPGAATQAICRITRLNRLKMLGIKAEG